MTDHDAPLGLTVHAAASTLGVSVSTIRAWERRGLLRARRTPGGHRRFSREQLDRFVHDLETRR